MNQYQPILISPQPNAYSADIITEVNKEGYFVQQANRYEIEQDAVFINYEREELLAKMAAYKSLNVYERKAYTKHIGVISRQMHNDDWQQFHTFLLAIAEDSYEIKNDFLRDVRETFYTSEIKKFQSLLVDTLLKLVRDHNLDIKYKAADLLGQLSSKIDEKQLHEYVLKQAVDLIHDDNEENKMVGVQLLTKLAGSLSREYCYQTVAKEMLSLGEHQSIRVRKEAVLCIPLLAKHVSQPFFQNTLLFFYQKKCYYNTWSVRKVCVDIIVELAKVPGLTLQLKEYLSKWILHFLKDGHKTVRVNAHKNLPMFLGVIELPKESAFLERLLYQYLKLIDSYVNQQAGNNDIARNVAFTFPAVLQAMGKQKWKQLLPIFNRLLKFTDKDVRTPLACSLHYIGRIIGPDLSKYHLFTCLDNILKDGCDELKLGSISHLTQFVEIFNTEIRENLIDVFLVLQKDPRKWRIRHSIASQIGFLAKIYTPQVVFQYIVPIGLKLCSDPVAEVRQEACKNIATLIDILKDDANHLFVVIELLKGYAFSGKFSQRQSFLQMIAPISKNRYIFFKYILPCLEKIAYDKVAIVRVHLSQFLASIDPDLRKYAAISKLIEILIKDPDPDISEPLKDII